MGKRSRRYLKSDQKLRAIVQIRGLASTGLNQREIAEELGLSKGQVGGICHRLRIETSRRRGPRQTAGQIKRDSLISALTGSGVTDTEVGEIFSISANRVQAIRKRLGVATAVGAGRPPKLRDPAAVAALLASGLTYERAALTLDVHIKTLEDFCRRHGIRSRRSRLAEHVGETHFDPQNRL